MTSPLLSIQDLEVSFVRDGATTAAVRGLSLDIHPGETVALVGESGSGKSVSALASIGLLADNARQGGQIRWKGTDFSQADDSAMRSRRGNEIGMVFQEPMTALTPVLTVGMQLTEALVFHGLAERTEANRRAVEMLNRVGIPSPAARMTQYPHELSGGMRPRVMIAIKMLLEPASCRSRKASGSSMSRWMAKWPLARPSSSSLSASSRSNA